MKRFMFALGLLATIAVSESGAAYLVIRIVLESGNLEPAATPSTGPGTGAPPPLAPPSFGGAPKGGPGPMGSSGGPPKGGLGPMGSSGGPPMGSAGGPPKGGPGPMGSGNVPPGSLTGSGLPQGMGGPATTSAPGHRTDPTRSIYVVVPYTNDITKKEKFYKKTPMGSFNPEWHSGVSVKHQFGRGNLLDDNTSTQLYLDLGQQSPKGMETRLTDLTKRRAKLPPAADAQLLLDLVSEALQNGYVSEAMTYADDVVKAVNERKAKASPQVERFMAAYAKIREDIIRPARSISDGAAWKERIGFVYTDVKDYISPHYHIIYFASMDAEMNRRAAQLEDNFKAFFLVNAVNGVAIPVPEKPLLAILPKSTTDVRHLSVSLDGQPAISDGFFSPDHGIVVLSPERLDSVSQTFNRQIQDMFRHGATRDQLLAGEGPKFDDKSMLTKKAEEVARMQTWVVAERFAEEEGEWSAVSREGTRQLLYATGFLPKHVSLPLWLSEGSANYWHRPKGPVFTRKDDKDSITVAITTGYGVPNYVRQKQFNEMIKNGQFSANPKENPDAGRLVRNVVTDAYFAASVAGVDLDNAKLPLPPPPPKATGPMVGAAMAPPAEDPIVVKRRRAEFLATKAQATSWSFYYFLANLNRPGLERYVAELNKQPRDLPLGENSRIEAFAAAFNISVDGKKTGSQITFEELGGAWLQYMSKVPPAGIDIPLQDLAASAPAGGGQPGVPPVGGGPGPGPGAPPKPGGGN